MRTSFRFMRFAAIAVAVVGAALAAGGALPAGIGTARAATAALSAAQGTTADLIAAGGNETCYVDSGAVWCQGYNFHGQLGIGTNTGPQPCGANSETGAATCSYIPVAAVSGMDSGVTAIAAGGNHICAVRTGAVWCWGFNNHGQLGNNSTTQSFLPFKVPDNAGTGFTNSGISVVSAGGDDTCALQGASVWCWGANGNGQLGINSVSDSWVPVKVPDNAGTGFTNAGIDAISLSGTHACALQGMVAWCWGYNLFGQLGINGIADSHVPVKVFDNVATSFTNSGVTAIAAGLYHTCAAQGGSAWCWGADYSGQLGNNAATGYSMLPLKVFDNGASGFTNSGITAISATTGSVAATTGRGDSSCAVKSGAVWCWGDGNSGQLGNNSAGVGLLPVAVVGLAGVTAISSGGIATCAIAGGVLCWGFDRAWSPEVGNAATDYCTSPLTDRCSLAPAPLAAPGFATNVNGFSAGANDTCAAMDDSSAWCWGANDWRQLSNGGTLDSHVASAVHSLGGGVSAVAAGIYDGCAIQNTSVWCWGSNAYGQLGTNSTNGPVLAPVKVFDNPASGFTNSGIDAVTVSTRNVAATAFSGASFACALKGGNVWCWGGAADGAIGNNMVGVGSGALLINPLAVAVVGLPAGGVTAISSGGDHTCALTNAGGVWCWGLSTYGQAGSNAVSSCNSRTCSPVAVSIPELTSGVTKISAGGDTTCAIQSGSLWCWGSNSHGQLGKNSMDVSSHPAPAKLPDSALTGFTNSGATSVAVGGSHVCAVLNDAAWCWGANGNGQLGDSGNIQSLVPEPVTGLGSGVASVSAGENHSCALTTAKSILCWGDNSAGQLGANTPAAADSNVPGGVLGLPHVATTCEIKRADVNGDGKVNIVDLASLAGYYNQNVPPAPARDDQNRDGKINIIDLSMAASVYNQLVSACP